MSRKRKTVLKKGIIIAMWIAVWFLAAVAVDNEILLVTPGQAFRELLRLLAETDFYKTVGMSLLRIGAGFLSGFGLAVLLAALSGRFPLLEEILSPVMTLLKAVPVASFVVLLLIWWGSSFLAVAICFLVVLPNIYINTLEGIHNTDRQLLEMAQVFRMPFRNRFFYIYRPAIAPFLHSSMKLSLGMCWKSGVAAEVIGTPDYSVGEQLYLSKIYLNTAGVFAWTAVVILLSVVFERLILRLTDTLFKWEPACSAPSFKKPAESRGGEHSEKKGELWLEHISKSYGGRAVLTDVSAVYRRGETYVLNSSSGSGKTTLLHILAGIVKQDSGGLERGGSCSMVFQEDRLCTDYSALKNVELVTGDAERARTALLKLLEPEDIKKPCGSLSGGMKRRVALVRAMEADSDYVLLDEPFTGMDPETRSRAERYIRERQQGRTLIIATHI